GTLVGVTGGVISSVGCSEALKSSRNPRFTIAARMYKEETAGEVHRQAPSAAAAVATFFAAEKTNWCWYGHISNGNGFDESNMPAENPVDALARWAFALEASETGAWELNLADGTAWRTRLHDQIFGYTERLPEWTYDIFLQHVVEEDRQRVDEAFRHAVEQRGMWRFDCRITRADGEERWIAATGRVYCDEEQKPSLMWGTVQDVTEQKRVEHELLKSEQRYRTLFHSMNEGFCIIEKVQTNPGEQSDYRFISTNPAFETHTGISNVEGKTVREVVPSESQEWFDTYDKVILTGEPAEFEREFVTERRILDLRAFRVGEVDSRRLAVIFRDVTESKRVEQALREADRQKDEFLAMLAHELRNPLAPIQSGIDYLRLAIGDVAANERIMEMMDRQIGSLKRLVDDLLDVSRITRGRLALQKEPLDLRDIVRDASASLSASMTRTVSIDLSPQPLVIAGDRVRLRQIVDNLLDNAAKFTRKTGGRIWISARRQGDTAILSVRDNGVGMEPAVLRQIFDMFFQNDVWAEREGLGIGLSLVHRLVELHEGEIEARSEGVGHGSEFVIRFPLLKSEVMEPSVRRGACEQQISGERILVLDDNEDVAESLATLLQAMGADVRTAYSGASALALLDEFRPKIALLDIGMPDMNGYEVAAAIRKWAPAQSVRLIAVTGWGQPADKARARAAGFDAHLTKPVEGDKLKSAIRDVATQS
ncbi:MAG: ATP-binding protein, partial [Woeseia sp.]